MKSIVLFRFHKNPAVCLNRLQLLKKYNPGIAIYGLYGGEKEDPEGIQKGLANELKHIFSIAEKSRDFTWKNSDLAVREWFENIGKNITFDKLYCIEWDLVLFDSLTAVYNHIPENALGLTGLVPLSRVEKEWSWTKEGSPTRDEWLALLAFAKKTYGYHDEPMACLGPGPVFPRTFLEKYASMEVPELAHDELRLPLFGQITKTPLTDTGFYKKWFSAPERVYFNCRNEEIQLATIQEELAKPFGRRVFHPVREVVIDL